MDSPVEGTGFEPSVPLGDFADPSRWRGNRRRSSERPFLYGGTDGSNPVPSSSESATKLASCIAALPRTGELIRVSRLLTSAKYRDPLNLDQYFRTCETSDGNQRTRRKIIAEDLLSQLSKAVTMAGVGDEHSHRDHISQGAAGLLEGLTEPGKYLADLPVKIAGKRFAGRICSADLPGQPDDPAAFSDDRL